MSNIRKLNQSGIIDAWLIAFVVTLFALFGALAFGVTSYTGKQDYKNNTDAKIAEAVTAAETKLTEKKEAEFTEREKQPLRTYNGPAAYGSVSITYPKTWSAYIDDTGKTSSAPLDGYLHPRYVPKVDTSNNIALRFQVVSSSYATVTKALDSQVKAGKIKTTPYAAAKVNGVVGLRVDGEVAFGKQGAMIVLPLRDKTIKIWTEASEFVGDFNDIILPNFTFVP